MSRRVVLDSRARSDLLEAAAWYEAQRAGLAASLLRDVRRTLRRIGQYPASAPLAEGFHPRGLVRIAPLHRFPYRVVYAEIAGSIRVLRVLHMRRSTEP